MARDASAPPIRSGLPTPAAAPLFVPEFLDAAACLRVRRAMDRGTAEPAEVLDEAFVTNDEVRRASHVEIDADTLEFLEGRLDRARGVVSQFFGIPLVRREGSSVLRYSPGGFFRPHRDWGHVRPWPDAARRRVAVVVFLTTSTAADASGTFSGGILRLFREDDEPFDVHPRAGTLVAFPAVTLHEVTDVRDGVRDAVVDWFY
jgi:predicted 2-oxoglutarate/Fe(II)-dependent dioxygenase YbiX